MFNKALGYFPYSNSDHLNIDWLYSKVIELIRKIDDISDKDENEIKEAVAEFINEHPEFVTTVMPNSITEDKIYPDFLNELKRKVQKQRVGYWASQMTTGGKLEGFCFIDNIIYVIKDNGIDTAIATMNYETGEIIKEVWDSKHIILNDICVGFNGELYALNTYGDDRTIWKVNKTTLTITDSGYKTASFLKRPNAICYNAIDGYYYTIDTDGLIQIFDNNWNYINNGYITNGTEFLTTPHQSATFYNGSIYLHGDNRVVEVIPNHDSAVLFKLGSIYDISENDMDFLEGESQGIDYNPVTNSFFLNFIGQNRVSTTSFEPPHFECWYQFRPDWSYGNEKGFYKAFDALPSCFYVGSTNWRGRGRDAGDAMKDAIYLAYACKLRDISILGLTELNLFLAKQKVRITNSGSGKIVQLYGAESDIELYGTYRIDCKSYGTLNTPTFNRCTLKFDDAPNVFNFTGQMTCQRCYLYDRGLDSSKLNLQNTYRQTF